MRFGFFLDGYDSRTGTCYEFFGCFFHACGFCLPSAVDEAEVKRRRLAGERTEKRLAFLRKHMREVVVCWECDFRRQMRENVELRKFVESREPIFYHSHKYRSVTGRELLKGVSTGSFFGALEVDICIPPEHRERFEVFSPIFAKAEIPFDSVGELMQNHIREMRMHENPRTLLVGGMEGQKLLIASDLLRWYLKKGLHITKVYQAVEYRGVSYFRAFIDGCTEARRAGDTDPAMKVIPQTAKLLANSSYSSLCINQRRFTSILYGHGQVQTCQLVNRPQFKCLDEISNSLFEVEMRKKTLRHTIPVQLASHHSSSASLLHSPIGQS